MSPSVLSANVREGADVLSETLARIVMKLESVYQPQPAKPPRRSRQCLVQR